MPDPLNSFVGDRSASRFGHADLDVTRLDFEANEAALRDLTNNLSTAELNWQPEDRRAWSILQCAEHLALAHGAYLGAMWPAVRGGKASGLRRKGPIRPSATGALFLKKLEPPVTRKVRAPKVLVPAVDHNKDEVMAKFARTHEQIRDLIRDAADLDLNGIKFRNPLLPLLRVRAGTGLLIMAAHERRHLWQARQVRNALEHHGAIR